MTHDQLIKGYHAFKQRYASGDADIMAELARNGQAPKHMVVACSDSRVDPALLLQANPGDLFVVRNVANIIPPYEVDNKHHGTSAALEFGICYLNVQSLIIMGHSECGGIRALTGDQPLHQDDFITNWVGGLDVSTANTVEEATKQGILRSHANAMAFPWIAERVEKQELLIDLWYFNIEKAELETFNSTTNTFSVLQ